MVPAVIRELKTVATEAKRSQKEDAVGSSWAALAAEDDPQGRGIGTLLVEAGEGRGAGGGGGGGEERGEPDYPLEECAWELYLTSNQISLAPSTHTAGRSSCKISKPPKVRQ